MRKHFGRKPRRALEPVGDVARRREEPPCLSQRDAVEVLHLAAERPVLGRLAELPELRAVELVRLPELVHEPHALVRMADEVGRELRRDDDVDRAAVGFVEIEQAPHEGLREDAGARVPLERKRHELGLVVARAKLVDEPVGEDLRPAPREGDLGPEDGDSHGFSSRSDRSSASSRSTCSWRSSTRRSAAALNDRWS